MNYELAKELKDAGFPQKKQGTLLFAPATSLAESQEQWNAKSAYAPSLSELIEACGDRFACLFAPDTTGAGGYEEWVADGKNDFNGSGSTPEEAVARLWLALNKT